MKPLRAVKPPVLSVFPDNLFVVKISIVILPKIIRLITLPWGSFFLLSLAMEIMQFSGQHIEKPCKAALQGLAVIFAVFTDDFAAAWRVGSI
ncbi:MAG: hypothetical protein LBV76_00780 [Deltaproteobacteria bacterium]|jgi:hypothetical protein|nr:hypothetical protein [Deltaproteobacteria bacterium]